ncbi:MAG: glycosyltransferase family 2 protein [Alphaproteobacteria bacterium]|nr:glycosyltransferase family 2 protein [Alphaproteobacteria bacterium]
MFKPIIIIPFFNHASAFEKIAPHLEQYKIPILVVNDGSAPPDTQILEGLCSKYHFNLIRNKKNGGKGATVKTGLNWALSNGYTHALQIDADGQHSLDDIPCFLKLSQNHPDHIIAAQPIYDSSAPKSRLYGRKITNFWVCVETMGRFKMDTMCGFRIYPLAQIKKILPVIWFNRMGFDVEILVKSFLNRIPILGQQTQVIYQKDGISHFHPFRDNLEISCVHTSLCVYSIWKFLTKWRHS